jgi:hypothetical protein
MNDTQGIDEILYALQGLALARSLPIPKSLTGLQVFAPFLDDVRQDKALFLLGLVPQPNDEGKDPCVASIGGGLAWDGGDPITIGDSTVEGALARAILEYARRCWQFTW